MLFLIVFSIQYLGSEHSQTGKFSYEHDGRLKEGMVPLLAIDEGAVLQFQHDRVGSTENEHAHHNHVELGPRNLFLTHFKLWLSISFNIYLFYI